MKLLSYLFIGLCSLPLVLCAGCPDGQCGAVRAAVNTASSGFDAHLDRVGQLAAQYKQGHVVEAMREVANGCGKTAGLAGALRVNRFLHLVAKAPRPDVATSNQPYCGINADQVSAFIAQVRQAFVAHAAVVAKAANAGSHGKDVEQPSTWRRKLAWGLGTVAALGAGAAGFLFGTPWGRAVLAGAKAAVGQPAV